MKHFVQKIILQCFFHLDQMSEISKVHTAPNTGWNSQNVRIYSEISYIWLRWAKKIMTNKHQQFIQQYNINFNIHLFITNKIYKSCTYMYTTKEILCNYQQALYKYRPYSLTIKLAIPEKYIL